MELAVRQEVVEALGLQTAGGQIKVRWDKKVRVTAQGPDGIFHRVSESHSLFD